MMIVLDNGDSVMVKLPYLWSSCGYDDFVLMSFSSNCTRRRAGGSVKSRKLRKC